MSTRVFEIGDTAVPLEMMLLDQGVADTGKAVAAAIRRVSDQQFLDFDDDTFKAVGWTTKQQSLTEVAAVDESAGVYRDTWDSSGTITEMGVYSIHYIFNDGTNDLISIEYAVFMKAELAQKILANKLVINDSTNKLEIYDDDGITLLATWPLTDKAGSAIDLTSLSVGLPSNRGAQD